MLLPNLRPKMVPHGSRLLPGLIVRTPRRLSSDERPMADAPVATDRHEAYLADKGFTGVQ